MTDVFASLCGLCDRCVSTRRGGILALASALTLVGFAEDVLPENGVCERELAAGRPLVLHLKQHDIAARWTALGNPSLPWTESQGAFTARPDANPPILAFVSASDLNRITVAADDLAHPLRVNGYLKYEHGAEIEISVSYPDGVSNRTSRVRIDTRAVPYWQSVREAAAWMTRANPLEPSPEAAFDPLWNSWYAYRTGISAAVMEREGKAAAELGLKNVIYDMGWDREGDVHSISFRPCGDWQPSAKNFPDMRSHFDRMHALGLKALVWFGYPLVGTESKIYGRAKAWCLNQTPDRRGTLTLDPRREEAFEHVRTRMEALAELGADGYKVDFIQTFGAYGAPDAAVMDFERRLKAALEKKFAALGKTPPLIEYMNIYGGPGNLAFATQVRASDCPGDAAENRARTARLRLMSGPKAVHCDMVTWDDGESPGRAAVQLISVLHSVIQVGRSVATLPPDHRRMLTNWLGFAAAHRETLLKGDFRPRGVVNGIVRTEMESDGERIVAVHAPETVVPITVDKTVYLLNGSVADALVVELDAPAEAELIDVFGATVGRRRLPKGLVRLDNLPTGSRAVIRKDYEALVDTRYGVMTPAKEVVSGRCLLGPCRPNGSIQPGPDTLYPERSKWKYPSPSSFHPSDEVSGFSQLHSHGTGGWPSYGLFLLSPTTAAVIEEPDLASPMTVETARPSYFRGRLERWNIGTEITSGRKAAMYRFTFPADGRKRLVLNGRRKNGERQGLKQGGLTVSGATVTGGGRYHHNWNPAEYDCYFAAEFSPAPITSGTSTDGAVAWLEFASSEVMSKIAVSFKSVERAAEYLAVETPGWDFAACRAAAAEDWNRELGRVKVKGFAGGDDARVFYSNLYHAMICPRDRTGDVVGWGADEPFWDDHHTLWDTWKTVFPLMSIIAPERYVSMVNSFGTRLRHNGECAASFIQTKDYRTGQSGDDVDNVIAEAWAKQVPGIDWKSVAEVLRFHAAERTEDYCEKGWVCSDVKHPKYCYRFASGSGTLGFAYNDWCAARVFEGLGEKALAERLFARSHNWTNVWDDAVVDEPSGFRGFARGKASDGRWVAGDRMASGCPVGEYSPRKGFNSYFYECTSFEASFTIMNDIPGMIAKMGGRDFFVKRLEYALENRLIEFGNEPSFMTIWLFDFVGRPDLASKWAAKLRGRFGFDGKRSRTGGWGIPGDDDSGAMGSLAVFLVAGFYPIAGTDLYALHGPAAKEVVFDVGGEKTFTVKAPGFQTGHVGFAKAVLNGVELKEPFIHHADIVKGGTLEFER